MPTLPRYFFFAKTNAPIKPNFPPIVPVLSFSNLEHQLKFVLQCHYTFSQGIPQDDIARIVDYLWHKPFSHYAFLGYSHTVLTVAEVYLDQDMKAHLPTLPSFSFEGTKA